MFETALASASAVSHCMTDADASPMAPRVQDYLAVPESRRGAIMQLDRELVAGRRVALSTHMNADGDGCGSETALARLLMQRGMRSRIVNPTTWPSLFSFLLGPD